jgi:sulfoxide reductase catalytic subunit YedY
MIPFDAAHKAVHYPEDHRFRICFRPRALLLMLVLVLAPVLLV